MANPKCTKCDLHTKCQSVRIIGKAYNSRPKYMIVLDFPTKGEDKLGRGPAGDDELKIKYFLEKAGIKITDVYITYALKCHVKKENKTKIKKEHLNACSEWLLAEIEKYKPKVLIPMGRFAFQMISRHTSIDEFVEHDYDFHYQVNEDADDDYVNIVDRHIKAFPAYSLNTSLLTWELNSSIIRSLKKAKKYVETGVVDKTPDPKINLILSLEALKEFEARIITKKYVMADFETTGLTFWKDKIINAGYCGDKDLVDVVFLEPYKKAHIKKWAPEEVELARQINRFVTKHKTEITATLERVHSSNIKWVFHNGKFDCKFAHFHGIPFKDFYWDTLVADPLVDENEGHSLNECYVRRGINYGPYDTALYPYVGKTADKKQKKKDSKKTYQHIPPSMIVKYLGYDVSGLRRMFAINIQELKECEMLDYFLAVKMPSLRYLLELEIRGVRYDKQMLLDSAKTLLATERSLKQKLAEMTGNPEFNPNSDMQISKYMVAQKYPLKKIGIPETSRGFSTKAEFLKKIASHDPKYEEFPKTVMAIKKITKIKGTYLDGKNSDGGMLQYITPDNMLHPNFNIWTAVTGRYSCFAKGTPVEIVRDLSKYPKGVPIEEVRVGDLAYCYDDNNNLTTRKVINTFNNGKKEVVKLHWVSSSGRTGYVEVTEDHLFKTYERGFVPANQLVHGEKILFMSRKKTWSKGYSCIMYKGCPSGVSEHHFVHTDKKGLVPKGFEVHHIDFNHLNNKPENLVAMRATDHRALHARVMANREERKRLSSEVLKRRWANGEVELPKGAEHPQYKGWSKLKILKIIMRSGCRTKKSGYDYYTITKYLDMHGLDLKELRDRFTHTGRFIRSCEIRECLQLKNDVLAIKTLNIGMSKWKRLKNYFLQETNHKFVCIERTGKFVEVFDLEVEELHNYIAGELCAHNCNKPSLQTFPRPIKGLINTRQFVIKTNPDDIMYEADFSALEQYVVGALSKDEVLIQKIKDGTDIHSFNAVTLGKALGWIEQSVTYEEFVEKCGKGKTPKEEIPKDVYMLYDGLRTKAKGVGFGLNYGKGAETFAEEFGITLMEAEEMIEAYFGMYKSMKRWRDKTVKTALTKGEIQLLSGRKRRFHMAVDWLNSEYAKKSWSARIIKEGIERQAMNFPIQGGAHEAFEEGCLRMYDRVKREGLYAHNQLSIHDGIVGSCKPHERELIQRIIEEEMVMTYNQGTPHELTLKIDVGFYSDRWYGEAC